MSVHALRRGAVFALWLLAATGWAQAQNGTPPLPAPIPPAPVPIPVAPQAAQSFKAPDPAPILRVETGMHTTLIRRLAVDAPRNRLITAGDDKTARVWQMPEARLISTLHVPIDKGHEGQLFGLAVSPDGATVAVGGWTAWDWEGAASVYFFDTASGALLRRHAGLPNAIGALAWTPDGKHLLIGLQGRAGLMVLRLHDQQIVAADPQYGDKIMDMDIDRSGRIATVSLDGLVRLYSPEFRLIGRRALPSSANKKLTAVRFSPDGALIAIGHVDDARASVVSGKDLSFAFHPAGDAQPGQVGFDSVAWSSEGEYLYAAGDYQGRGRSPLYRWGKQGQGTQERIPLADNRITEIRAMPNSAIAYAAEDPAIGIIDAQARPMALRGPDIIDFSAAHGQLAVSADGAAIRYPIERKAGKLQNFSPLLGGDQDLNAPHKAGVRPPKQSAPGWRVENWKNSREPLINGKRPKLDDYEIARSYAIAPDNKSLLLGTEWALRLLDRNAREIWNVGLPAVVWAVNITQHGKLAVAALSDGTIRWYRLRDGKEIFAYFPHNNGQDWIAWAPSGYYVSSIYGDNFVGWHLNRGKDLAPDFYRAVQFDRILYRPDIVVATFKAELATKPNSVKIPSSGGFDISKLGDIAPPRLLFKRVQVQGADSPRLHIEVQGEKNRQAIQDVTVFVNNIPVTPNAERMLRAGESEHFMRTIEVDLFDRHNNIRAEAFDGHAMGVAETYVAAPGTTALKPPAGKLYVLAVGVNQFAELPSFNLDFAAGDAEGFAKTMRSAGKSHFKEVVTHLITDNTALKPRKETIVQALEFVKQSQPEDTVIVFLASHGMSDASGNYYFIPHDAKKKDLLTIDSGSGKVDSLISWATFFDALRGATGRRILIVDTCQARNIEGKLETHSLMKRSASSLFSMIMSSKGDEQSQEYPPGNHGLFTYSLLNALQAGSDANRDGMVSVNELFSLGKPIVEKLRDKSIGEQTPQLIAPAPLGDTPLMRAAP